MKNSEHASNYDTSINRIKLPRKVSEPIYLKLEDLESIREIQLAQRKERIQDFQSRGW